MKNYVPSLNGLRAISIFIVIFHHLNAAGSFGAFHAPGAIGFLFDGNFGVNVFFVISGFLITSLLIAEEKQNGTISIRNFYIRRIFRIFPAYYFVLFVYFLLQNYGVLFFTRDSWFSSLFYYKYFVRGDAETAHFWSLSVEEHFYLVWPLVFLLFRKWRTLFAAGIIGLVFACRLLAYNHTFHLAILGDWAFIFQRADALMIGCLCAMYKDRLLARMDRLGILKVILLLLPLVMLNSEWLEDWNSRYGLHLGFLLVPLNAAAPIGTITNLLIAALLLFSIHRRNWWFGFLNMPVMNFLGKLSYSLYLWQQLFLMSGKIGILGKLPVNLCCCFLAALFSYYLVELPFQRLKSRFGSGRKNAPVAHPALEVAA
jgi:peptidoglycan/LPS O-acetylase OafA/YrhL